MTVVREREQTYEECPIGVNWLTQRGFYEGMTAEDQADINSFLLHPDSICGVSPRLFQSPVISQIADVAMANHADQWRKAAPTHPYMKHVFMTTFQVGRLLPGGDLETSLQNYIAWYGEVEIPEDELAGAALLHDTLECNPFKARWHLYNDLVANGVDGELAECVTATSQFMVPAQKPPHLAPERYLEFKEQDVLRYYSDEAIRRLKLSSRLVARLVKGADVRAVGKEIIDDILKGREGINLVRPDLFNAALDTRLKLIHRRLELFQQHDPLNPFIPAIAEICEFSI